MSVLDHGLQDSSIEQWMNKLLGPFVTIFTIHRPSPITGAYGGLDEHLLEQCLDYATQKDYRFISVDQLIAEALRGETIEHPTISFTLDDGYADQATRLLPILLDYKTSPSLFVITDFIDGKLWSWDAKLSYLLWNTPLQKTSIPIGSQQLTLDLSTPNNRIMARRQAINLFKLLNPETHDKNIAAIADLCKISLSDSVPEEFSPVTWNCLRQLEQQGLRVGSHSQTHLVFNAASDITIAQELKHSKERLNEELHNPSNVFCYPLGTPKDFTSHHIELVKNAGYSAALSTISNVTNSKLIRENPFQVQRIAFPNSFEKFVRYTSWKEALRSKLPF